MDNRPPMDEIDTDFVAKMSARPRPSEVVDWPGNDPPPGYEKIRIVVPPEKAYSIARLNAHNRMKAETKLPTEEWNTEGNQGIFGDIVAKEMLAACCHRDRPIPGSEETLGGVKYQRLFGSSKDVEKALTKDEISILYDLFLMVEHRLGPRFAILTPEEVDVWIERLKGGLGPLARLVYPDLVELIRGLHQRVIELSGFQIPDSPYSNSLDTSDWTDPGISATDKSSYGEQQGQ